MVGARWIGGREAQDHDWKDLTASVVFRGGSDAAGGLSLLLRAEPVGKTWGEGLNWTIRQSGDDMQLVMKSLSAQRARLPPWPGAGAVRRRGGG
ncbi:hypothetical protein [Streptomyces sp. NL15-2K]|uniref:hypothetical protein n=1 Tax=Streptomyces sp. NL15-2K TaxID=376149 RepID=UPI00209BDFE9|nr:hypothetical protein [Streptomyces sp. NL15-2K]